ncbi:single-stranded DNA-binding protein [Hyphomicrobiales bacterium]|nr:single-stranded DNA-binding protein [Rhodobiaceae bacterium]MBT6222991.1 single-stranded DNA-binding protein [Rhodobiaceae bacterium]MDB4127963.1 single-stranded DNA-binding protein [Hyphomicrobiales bacterium]
MAGSINKVTLIGRLGNDPDVRSTQDGRSIVNLSVATSETWKDKNSGEKREKTEWHRVVIFNEGLGKIAQQYLNKGSKVYLEGQLQTRKWEDKSGQEKYTTEVVIQNYSGNLTLLDSRNDNSSQNSQISDNKNDFNDTSSKIEENNEFDDEIPF